MRVSSPAWCVARGRLSEVCWKAPLNLAFMKCQVTAVLAPSFPHYVISGT